MAGVRIITVSLGLIEQIFESGTDRCVPVEPAKLRVVAARQAPRYPFDAVELLVESESFPEEGSGNTWETAQRLNPSFRRWPEPLGLWAHAVPEGACDVRLVLRFNDGREFEAQVPEGSVEICAYELEPASALVRDKLGNYQNVPLVKVVAPSEPSGGPPV